MQGYLQHSLYAALFLFLSLLTQAKKDISPPIIRKEPERETPYKIGEKITLECVATGDPQPKYSWTKDGKLIDDLDDIDAYMLANVGTLVIDIPGDKHDGYYQCAAENTYGKALSVRTLLKKATLNPFPDSEVHKKTPNIGESLTLECNPPYSYPKPSIHWAVADMGSLDGDMPKTIENSRRRAVDYEGNLRFANILPEDDLDGSNYVCVLWNSAWRGSIQGNDQQVIPMPILGKPPYRAPLLMFPTDLSPVVALKGANHKMMCFFEGSPTPNVTWLMVGTPKLPQGTRQSKDGLELKFSNLDYSHAGTYKCCGNNQKTPGYPVCQELQLKVESRPIWEVEPKDTEAADEEDATFTCKATGKPTPQIVWSINGEVVDPSSPGERRVVAENTITFLNLNRSDNLVVQCNASNAHGYIFKNAFLNVKSEPPSFQPPMLAANTKTAVDSQITLSCRAYGVPKPTVTWRKQGKDIAGSRFKVQDNGDLVISPVMQEDKGNYQCEARNKLDTVSRTGYLTVRNATKITVFPKDQEVNAPKSVTFQCSAETDKNEESQLTINWKRNGTFIKLSQEQRISKNLLDNSLTIENTDVSDTNQYTCVASNQLDADEHTASLTVKDRPDPPKNVLFQGCSGTSTTITWKKGNNNNAPIDSFIVFSNTSFDEPGIYHEEKRTDSSKNIVAIRLSNWANYTFHVIAHNEVGNSERSSFTSVCETAASKPYRNPTGVCTENRQQDQLVIRWHSMPRIEHNGLDFHYEVSWKLQKDTVFKGVNITDYRSSEHVVPDQEAFQLYDVKVRAINKLGAARRPPKMVPGYSGEGDPLEAPNNLKIVPGSLNSTSAIFEWDPVDTRPEKIKGHFIGYQIQFWKSDDTYEKKRIHDVMKNPNIDKCPKDVPVKARKQRLARQAPTQETGHVMNLWPFSKITAVVVVLTSKLGPQSKSIEFTTPEGVPGPVSSFQVTQIGSHHFVLQWGPPVELNGNVIGYTITYSIVGQPDIKTEYIDNPAKFRTKLIGLEPDSSYVLSLSANTGAGIGVPTSEDAHTRISSAPDVPGFANIAQGESSLNVSWVHSQDKEENPGSEFYVEYRKVGSEDWLSTSPESELNWANVTDLENGAAYEIRIVARNGHDDVSRSDIKTVRVGGVEEAATASVATAAWFIGMMIVLLLLLLILIIICLIKRNRGGKYPVHEKEKLRGRDPEKEDEENQFGEYTKTPYMELKQSDTPDYKKSAGSLESEEKPLESDTDSMAEYDQMDPSKFNEDGSFIGQYGGKGKHDQDTTSPSALSTFV